MTEAQDTWYEVETDQKPPQYSAHIESSKIMFTHEVTIVRIKTVADVDMVTDD